MKKLISIILTTVVLALTTGLTNEAEARGGRRGYSSRSHHSYSSRSYKPKCAVRCVSVRGYVKKNGTVVAPYTRSYPTK